MAYLLTARRLVTYAALVVVAALILAFAAPAHAATVVAYRATFTPGVTDGLSKVSGRLRIYQNTANQTTVLGKVTGLQPNSLYVAVPYTDPNCTPLPGVTAFPSGVFFTDATGAARVWTTVNPKSINPAGSFTASQTRSVSIRRVIVQGLILPGAPAGVPAVPTVPNVVAVEACDRQPVPISQ